MVDLLNTVAAHDGLVYPLRHPKEAEQMGRNGRRATAERYNWERESERLVATCAELPSV